MRDPLAVVGIPQKEKYGLRGVLPGVGYEWLEGEGEGRGSSGVVCSV